MGNNPSDEWDGENRQTLRTITLINNRADHEPEIECWTVPLLRASWLRVDVASLLGAYVIQSPHWHFRWRCNNNRRNTLNGRVISSAYLLEE